MIVDCHTHVWQSPDQLGPLALGECAKPERPRTLRPIPGRFGAAAAASPAGDAEYHWSGAADVDKSIVLGFKSRLFGADIPNSYVADYVSRYPQKLIGFAGIDPTEDAAVDELVRAQEQLKLRGLVLCPPSQGFHPADTRAMRVYERAEQLGMPVVFHPGTPFAREAKMEFARPMLLDEIARSFPRLKIVIGQLGHPWIDETLSLIEKHPFVYADISGLLRRPWQAYNALLNAFQAGAIDRLLFGSNFPYSNAGECIEKLYSLNQMLHGTNLPMVPRESLRGIVERETLTLLGLE